MRRIVKLTLFICLLAIVYSIFWYIIAIDLCNNINKSLKENNNKITFDFGADVFEFSLEKVSPYGFPFKIGLKFINLEEDGVDRQTNQRYLTSHKGLITLTYDFLKSGFVFSNFGESVVRVKPLASGFGVRVVSENSYFVKIPITSKLFQVFRDQFASFELVNFVKRIKVKTSGVRAYDLVNDVMIFDHELSDIDFSWKNAQYYKSFEELQNNIPKNYSIKINTVTKEVAENKKIIAPPSFVYFLLGQSVIEANIEADFQTKANEIQSEDIFKNSSIKIKRFDIISPVIKANFKGSISSESFESLRNYAFAADLELNSQQLEVLKPYFINLNSLLQKEHSVDLFKDDERLWDLLKNTYSFKLNTAGACSVSKKIKNLSLESFYFMFNEHIGFNLRGQSSFSSPRDWYLEGNVLMYNFTKMIDDASEFLIKYQGYSPDIVNGSKESVKMLFRGISSSPVSNSPDLSIDLQLSHNINSSKIGRIPLTLFLEKYNSTLNTSAP